jgi:NADH:ubiquinone reductase (non-electrogenic)
MEWLTEPSLL